MNEEIMNSIIAGIGSDDIASEQAAGIVENLTKAGYDIVRRAPADEDQVEWVARAIESQMGGKSIDMARAAIAAMPGWRTIESAPKGRDDMIDVWCVPFPGDDFKPSRGGIRLTDVFWYEDKSGEGWARLLDDGNIDFVEMRASQPGGLPPWKPTHWHPHPAPPKPEGA